MIRFITYSIKPYDSDDSVVVSEEFWAAPNLTLIEACVHQIAGGRNIAALWDVERVMVDGTDLTDAVKDVYDRLYVSRRPEFMKLMGR